MTTPTYETMVRRGREADREAVRVDRGADRALVTFAEPERLNALSAVVVRQLRDALESLAADPEVRAIVLTGEDPGFSAGGDLEMMDAAVTRLRDTGDEAGTTDIWRWIRYEFGGIVRLIARTDKAFIAAINGPAAGVGLAFALTCDLAIASERALLVPAFGRLGLLPEGGTSWAPTRRLGLLPEVGTSWALTRRLGYQGAFAFYAGGRHVDAHEAQRLGLVHEVVPHDDLPPTAGAGG